MQNNPLILHGPLLPDGVTRPLVGITGNIEGIDVSHRRYYGEQIIRAGGVPVVLQPMDDPQVLSSQLDALDALILSGGGDVNALYCGEEPSPLLGNVNGLRDRAELRLAGMALRRGVPTLGICRGMQVMAIAGDGKVAQDMEMLRPQVAHIKHSQTAEREEPTHLVSVKDGSLLHRLYATPLAQQGMDGRMAVNSFHHQAVADCGTRFTATATAADGVVEAMESTDHKPLMAVQWHPECLGEDGMPLFRWLVSEAMIYHKARVIHHHIITLDTHNDNPMDVPELLRFTEGNAAQVDLLKMTDGRQDATTMVAYLPQPKGHLDCTAASAWRAFKSATREFDPDGLLRFDSAAEFADAVFDKIESQVALRPDRLAMARNADDLLANKRAGKKSIMIGIENGLAIGHDISLLQHFKNRGVVYVTLCHNGDNLLCDSASRTDNTHGGLAAFGGEVVAEMNRLGIMVDMSHAGQRSFFDALEASSQPIVCSHSNCRELCDHPRNLTDEQLRALARKGGVAHTTFYNGFLTGRSEATVLDAIAHLQHAIDVMGIDHVGIGTDFDGGGGVPGMQTSADMLSFTMHLLRRRFSEDDIRKIWGGNWLRVMREVQGAANA